MTDTPEATAPHPAGGIATFAGEAEKVVNELAAVEPWIARLLPIIVPSSAPVAAAVAAYGPVLLTGVARALDAIAKGNNNDVFGAVIEVLQHLDPKSAFVSPALAKVDGGQDRPVGG